VTAPGNSRSSPGWLCSGVIEESGTSATKCDRLFYGGMAIALGLTAVRLIISNTGPWRALAELLTK